jgi:hypothetical protein
MPRRSPKLIRASLFINKSRFVDLFSLLLSSKNVIISIVKHAPAAQMKLLALLAVKYAASRQVKLSVPNRAEGTLHARSALHIRRMLHVPHQRNT